MAGTDPAEWAVVPRLALISCVLLLAGCGAARLAPGVEVVESQSNIPAPPEVPPRPAAPIAEDEEADTDVPASGRPNELLASVEIVSGPALPPRPASMVVIGDSLTLSAQEEISEAIAPTEIELIVVDGVENRRMTRGTSAVPPATAAIKAVLEDAEPELWVLALGTNDVGAQSGTEVFGEDIDELLDLLPVNASVIWVDLWIRDRDDMIVEANEAIRLKLGHRGGVGAVVDWHTRADSPGIITGDGVHLTEDGQQLFADSIVNAIDATFAN